MNPDVGIYCLFEFLRFLGLYPWVSINFSTYCRHVKKTVYQLPKMLGYFFDLAVLRVCRKLLHA